MPDLPGVLWAALVGLLGLVGYKANRALELLSTLVKDVAVLQATLDAQNGERSRISSEVERLKTDVTELKVTLPDRLRAAKHDAINAIQPTITALQLDCKERYDRLEERLTAHLDSQASE